jgi:hypothetical protein
MCDDSTLPKKYLIEVFFWKKNYYFFFFGAVFGFLASLAGFDFSFAIVVYATKVAGNKTNNTTRSHLARENERTYSIYFPDEKI